MGEKTYFARPATGLVRNVGVLENALYNMWFGLPVMSYYTTLYFAFNVGANPIIGYLLVALTFTPLTVVYAALASSMPRSGGDYVYLSRIVHPALGFMTNFAFQVWWMFCFAFNTLVISNFIGTFLREIGTAAVIPGCVAIGSTLEMMLNPGLQFAVCFLLIVGAMLVQVLGLRVYLAIQWIAVIMGFITVFIVAGVFLSIPRSGFISAFNAYASPLGLDYDQVILNAQSFGYVGFAAYTLGGTLLFVPNGNMTKVPYASNWVGGELKAAGDFKKHIIAMLIGGGFISLAISAMQVLGWVGMAGQEFTEALSFGYFTGTYELTVPPFFYAWLGILGVHPAIAIFANLTVVVVIFWGIATNCFAISRSMFAWGMDRLVPSAITRVDRRFHSPWVAIVTAGSTAILLDGIMILGGVNMYAWTASGYFVVHILLLIIMASAMFYPYSKRAKHVYETSPVRGKFAGLPTLTWLALAAFLMVFCQTLVFFLEPFWFAAFGMAAVLPKYLIFVQFVVPVVYYFIRRAYLKNKGVDMDAAYREIPPE